MLHNEPYVHSLGALTGNMAMQQVTTHSHSGPPFSPCHAQPQNKALVRLMTVPLMSPPCINFGR